jgi:Tfp pilus assembly protein PilO
MKTEIKIVSRIIRLKESLGLSKALYILCACCVLSGLIILIFAYRPLITKLHDASNRLQELETELLNQRSAIAALEQPDVKGGTIQQNEIPLAIDELTEKGKDLGLHFSSISPSELQQTTQVGIWKLPISFTIESEYENVGQFLDYIEGASPIIAEAERLSIRPRGDNLSKLSVELALNLYVERKNETK